uniref:MULE transposase domain-containing protein n=1 Tax=Lactuca sativa TaxID=4236 RepID=A0A9R1XCU8_LACSA|nr:hypothetical protein LSAT_V11C500273660 [Lactuca sativa]
MRFNLGSTIQIYVTINPDKTTTYHRILSNKDGKLVVVELLVLMEGRYKCKVLNVIGKDKNNHVYPVVWIVVDIENNPNWNGLDLCVISDQHKGLLEAAKVVLPHVEHRQYAIHVYANFRKVFSGIEFKKMFWIVFKSTVEGDFKLNMENIREVNLVAYNHLMAREPKSWCMGFYKGRIAYEAVENGIEKCFNVIILEVRDGFYSYGVNLEGIYYTCKLWEFSGIPYVHAQATIIYIQQDPDRFTNTWFGKDKFLATYGSNILPVNGSHMWEPTPYTKQLPPIKRMMPGRPSIKRKRHVSKHEDRAELSNVKIVCKGGTINYLARIPHLTLTKA